MILDSRGEFGSNLALSTVGVGLALVGNVIDSVTVRDIGGGRPVFIIIQVMTAITSGGLATVEFDLVSDSVAAIHVDGTAIVHEKTGPIPVAQLVAGFAFRLAIPSAGPAFKRFLGLLQNVGAFALTGGAITATMTLDPAASPIFPAATS